MALNSQWNKVYEAKKMAAYPETEFVRFVARNYYNYPNRKEVKFFDVGCGAGSNTWYLAREGFTVAAIDGSIVAIERLKERLDADRLDSMLVCADIASLDMKEDVFDCIVDVSSLCYVPDDEITKVMSQLHKVLKPGGKFFSIAPSNLCYQPPFNHTIDGVNLESRFLRRRDLGRQFDAFSEVKVSTYEYGYEDSRIHLWETHAVK